GVQEKRRALRNLDNEFVIRRVGEDADRLAGRRQLLQLAVEGDEGRIVARVDITQEARRWRVAAKEERRVFSAARAAVDERVEPLDEPREIFFDRGRDTECSLDA